MADMNIELARHNMIEQQIRPWDVLDQRVLDVILRTPRELYVPPALHALAFTDMPVPLGHDQYMMEPKLEGKLLQALAIKPSDTILEIGTGSGYVTAMLASLGKHVDSVDIIPEFTESARDKLNRHGITNVKLDTGDAIKGWNHTRAYSAIAVTGSVPLLTSDIQQCLEVGGRMFIIVGEAPIMEAKLITRLNANEWQTEDLFETYVPALINAPRSNTFKL